METFYIDIHIQCNKCNSALSSSQEYVGRDLQLSVDPCEHCLEEAKDDRFDKGFGEGESSVAEATDDS